MNNSNEGQFKKIDIIAWVGIGLVTIGAFFLTYYYNLSAPIKAIVWIAWLLITLLLAYLTQKGKQVVAFAQEAKVELQKVVWPTREETVQTTSIVMLMVAVTGFTLWGVDTIM